MAKSNCYELVLSDIVLTGHEREGCDMGGYPLSE
jgi:hypothetical protein